MDRVSPELSTFYRCCRMNGKQLSRESGARPSSPFASLTHFAVETTLGYAHGFYGLVADGWDIADFAAPWPSGPLSGRRARGRADRVVGWSFAAPRDLKSRRRIAFSARSDGRPRTMDESFDFGLARMLDGIERYVDSVSS